MNEIEAEMGIHRMLVLVVRAFCTVAISHGVARTTVGKLSQNDFALTQRSVLSKRQGEES
jgi:hypothetical protein